MRLVTAFAAGLLLGAVLTVTEPAESSGPAGPNLAEVIVSCLNGGMVVDGELWICHPTGAKVP